jgi:subtilisin family serine protease
VLAARIVALRRSLAGLLAAALVLPAAALGAGDPPPSPAQLDAAGVHDIIVKRRPGLDASDRAQIRAAAGVTYADRLRLPDTEVVHADPGGLADALAALRADPSVEYAEPDARVHAFTNDAYWPLQWALENDGQSIDGGPTGVPGADIHAPAAWALGATGAGQTVAVVDTGVNAAHPDLVGQLATNPGETGGGRETNRVDDDHDGIVDDWRGWDWVQHDNNPDDRNGHGSHVAGIIAARQARTGITGAAPDARILPLRALDADGFGSDADIANAFAYAGDLGIGVVNASLGGPGISNADEDAFAAHPQTLYVVAAGNDGEDNDSTTNYPCDAPQDNVICVGATDNSDQRASFSNYGRNSVDLFAPGVAIVSAWKSPELGWWLLDGTSMAAPHVAAAVALVRAAAPSLDAGQVKQALLDTVDDIPALHGYAVTGGRVDAAAAVQRARAMTGPTTDFDGDTVPDVDDDCPSVADVHQEDADTDGVGDACDPTPHGPDDDADGVADTADDCVAVANPGQADADGDGLGDACDPTPHGPDGDGDGVPDARDDCVAVPNPGQADTDGDGLGDACDPWPAGPPPVAPAPAAAPLSPASPLAPPPAAPAADAPALGALTAPSSARTLRACRAGAAGCRPDPLRIAYRLDRAATVTAQVQRRGAHGRYATVATVRARGRAGANTLTIGTSAATRRLRAGAYRLRVVAGTSGAVSAARTLAFRVR